MAGSHVVSFRYVKLPPLHAAASRGDVPALKTMLASSADSVIDARDSLGRTALHVAALAGSVEACAALLNRRCQVDTVDESGCTALHAAASGGHVRVMEALLSKDAAVDARSTGGWTPLHVAAEHGKAAACKCLLAHRASPSARGDAGAGMLHLAAVSGDVTTCEMLLAAGADATAPDHEGNQPLHVAALRGSSAVCAWLRSRKVDLFAMNESGWTAAHIAADFGHVDVLSALGAGPHVSVASRNRRWTPLHIAALKGHVSAFEQLLKLGADLESRDCDGETAAHLAAWNDRCSIVQFLVERKSALLLEADDAERRPFDVAPPWGHTAHFLTRAGYAVAATKGGTTTNDVTACDSASSITSSTGWSDMATADPAGLSRSAASSIYAAATAVRRVWYIAG
jgi:ankyrin repeat protein